MTIDLEGIKKRRAAITPGNWYSNSYSAIFTDGFSFDKYDDLDCAFDDKPPADVHSDEYEEWCKKRAAAYEVNPHIASVPSHYGDTPTGTHAGDADFIANSPADVDALIAEVEALTASKEIIEREFLEKGRIHGEEYLVWEAEKEQAVEEAFRAAAWESGKNIIEVDILWRDYKKAKESSR